MPSSRDTNDFALSAWPWAVPRFLETRTPAFREAEKQTGRSPQSDAGMALTSRILESYLSFQWSSILALAEELAGLPRPRGRRQLMARGYACAIMAAACIRTRGQTESSWEGEARRLSRELACPELAWIVDAEWAAWLMGLGHFKTALAKLSKAPLAELGTYLQARVHTIRFVTFLYLGHLSAAGPAVRELERVLQGVPHGSALLARFRLMLHLERDELHLARRVVEEHALFRRPESTREYNLQVEQIRFHFFTGNDETANRLLAFAEQYSSQRIADVHGEQLLRSHPGPATRDALLRMLSESQRTGSLIGECDCFLLLARWHLLNNDFTQARCTLARVAALAQGSGFVRALCRSRILSGLVHVREANPLDGILDLREAKRIALRHGLTTLKNISAILLAAIEPRNEELEWLSVLKYLGNRRTRFEYTHIRTLFPDDGFRVAAARNLYRGGRTRRISLLQLCDEVLDHAQCAVLRLGTGSLLFRQEDSIKILSLRRGEVLFRAVQFVLSTPGGNFGMSSLSRAIWGTREFRPERHAARCRSLVARLRILLDGYVAIDFDAAASRYRVLPLADFLVISRRAPSTRESSENRESQILALIRNTGGMSSGALGKQLGISRQALHKYLRALVEQGFVRMRQRGRSTLYLPLPSPT